MAATEAGAALTDAYRYLQVRLFASITAGIVRAWEGVDPTDLRGTFDRTALLAAQLVARGRLSSSAAAVRYYRDFRMAEGQRGVFEPVMAPAPSDSDVHGLMLGAGLRGVTDAFRRGADPVDARDRGVARMVGSAAQVVLGGGRETILSAVVGDPRAVGYQRVTGADPCAFCAMIAARGVIRVGRGAAEFHAHGHCACGAEPAFVGSPINDRNAKFRDAWNQATAGLGGENALTAFRQHLAANTPAKGREGIVRDG